MSLSGQWLGEYSGTNSGWMVVDIDDRGSHYSGTACAWDSHPEQPNTYASFRTNDKNDAFDLQDLPVIYVDNGGNRFSNEVVDSWAQQGRISRNARVTVRLVDTALQVKWSTSIGTSGEGSALAPRTRAGKLSDLLPLPVENWDQFKAFVGDTEPARFVYRGQESNTWRLRSSFHRTGRADLLRYEVEDLPDLHKYVGSATNRIFDFANRIEFASFITLAQHHGYPTPLLDWTWSPYVAAYFAFFNLQNISNASGKKVRIFKLDLNAWNNNLPQADKIFAVPPHLSTLDGLGILNPRVVPQRAISTFTNVDDIEAHIAMISEGRDTPYLEAIDLCVSERRKVVSELDLMGINAGSLFPGIDGVCASMRDRKFNR